MMQPHPLAQREDRRCRPHTTGTLTLVLVAGFLVPATEPLAAAGTSQVVDQQAEQAEVPAVMEEPMDGSSIKRFERDMERVREEAGDGAHQLLDAAVDYLLYYRFEARGDREKLYQLLDGMTPLEIIAEARNR